MGTLDSGRDSDDAERPPPTRDFQQWFGGTERDLWSSPDACARDVARDASAADGKPTESEDRPTALAESPELKGRLGGTELTPEERAALDSYTSAAGGYRRLNFSLWSGTLTEVEDVAPWSHDLSSTLQKLPETRDTVYRGSDPSSELSDEQLARYVPGDVVINNGYTSASLDAEREFGGRTLWVIDSQHGKIVDDLSKVPEEREVIFDRFTQFEVLANDYDEELQRRIIYMRERES